jgi:hypothetical protein
MAGSEIELPLRAIYKKLNEMDYYQFSSLKFTVNQLFFPL